MELKNCPFCDSSVQMEEDEFKSKTAVNIINCKLYKIQCKNCAIYFSSSKKEFVINKWNERKGN